jgi:hypothetical protein
MVSFLSASANKSHFNNENIAVVTTFDNLKGKWQRKEDGMHIWTLNDDGSYSQIYNNETQVSGKWGIYSETKDNGGKADANGTFLWLTAADGQVYCYKIEDMTATTFKLKNQTILYEFVKM